MARLGLQIQDLDHFDGFMILLRTFKGVTNGHLHSILTGLTGHPFEGAGKAILGTAWIRPGLDPPRLTRGAGPDY